MNKVNRKYGLILWITALTIPALAQQGHGRFYRYLGEPLFNYRVEINTLPRGNYTMVRSSGRVTQVLVSTAWNRVTLYTDRDNTGPGKTAVSSADRLRMKK